MEKKPIICKHCQGVNIHHSFQCHTQRKPIRPKVGDKLFGAKIVKEEKKDGAVTLTIKPRKSKETVSELLKLAEIVFNRWIRKRDTEPNGFTFICIACNLAYSTDLMDAGHFYSKTYSNIRFHEDNLHGECQLCNRMDVYHLIGYEFNLINKIGTERFKALTKLKNKPKKWERSELLEIINKYKL